MATASIPVSDLLVTTKSREMQRAEFAEARGDRPAAVRHFLAAAHLELVLSSDYTEAGQDDLATRSRVGAASCLWRAGRISQAREMFAELSASDSADLASIALAELESKFPEAH